MPDLDLELDEFCRLGRLGDFHRAREFFRENLEEHRDNPYVFVQYAQLLLEKGDYKNIMTLDIPYLLKKPDNVLLQTNWKLIQSIAYLHTEGLGGNGGMLSEREAALAAIDAVPKALQVGRHELSMQNVVRSQERTQFEKRSVNKEAMKELGYDYEETELSFYIMQHLDDKAIKDLMNLSEKYKPIKSGLHQSSVFGSTESHILSLSLHFLKLLPNTDMDMFDWSAIYEIILRQGRIWDFRDIIIAAAQHYGHERACEKIMGKDEAPAEKINADWALVTYDESTNLALLDVLVSVVLARPFSPWRIVGVRDFVDQAGHIAYSIIQNQPSNLKSRQYIRWILAKIAITDYRDNISTGPLSELPGLFLTNLEALDLSVYIPVASETPEWALICLPSKSSDTQQMILNVARGLGDLATEAECLKQIIAHSQDPTKYYSELIHLQKTVQNDLEGWLRTCLSKYIISRNEKSRDILRQEILSVHNYTNFDPELVFARCMILRALAKNDREKNHFLAEARECSRELSSTIRSFMKDNQLMAKGTSRDRDLSKGDSKADVFSGVPTRRQDKERIDVGIRDENSGTAYLPKRAVARTNTRDTHMDEARGWASVDVPPVVEQAHREDVQGSKSETLSPGESTPSDSDESGDVANVISSYQLLQCQDHFRSTPYLLRGLHHWSWRSSLGRDFSQESESLTEDPSNMKIVRNYPGHNYRSTPYLLSGSYHRSWRFRLSGEFPQETESLTGDPSMMQIIRYYSEDYHRSTS